MMILEDIIKSAHKHSFKNIDEIKISNSCGCFYCLHVFKFSDIKETVDDNRTVLCPECSIDSVIGSKSGYPITKEFLKSMKEYFFLPRKVVDEH